MLKPKPLKTGAYEIRFAFSGESLGEMFFDSIFMGFLDLEKNTLFIHGRSGYGGVFQAFKSYSHDLQVLSTLGRDKPFSVVVEFYVGFLTRREKWHGRHKINVTKVTSVQNQDYCSVRWDINLEKGKPSKA